MVKSAILLRFMYIKKQYHRVVGLTAGFLGMLTAFIFTVGAVRMQQTDDLFAQIVRTHSRQQIPWKTLDKDMILRGGVAPADTNVIIKIPDEIDRISRRVLFGRAGDRVRYWGYCFPQRQESNLSRHRSQFPGLFFLSEKEREVLAEIEQEKYRLTRRSGVVTDERILNGDTPNTSLVRHQKEIFNGGDICMLMTNEPIVVSADNDGDILSNYLEKSIGTDPESSDTDKDGISDGLEYHSLKTNPLFRDSDGDKLLDGIEDANKNGRKDINETDANKIDTDGDGLCDGYCLFDGGTIISGEDVNLNGVYEADKFETNPLSKDSDDDGVLDEYEDYLCLLKEEQEGEECEKYKDITN